MGCFDALPPWEDLGDDIRRFTWKEIPLRKCIENCVFTKLYKESWDVYHHSSTMPKAIIDIRRLYTYCVNTKVPIYSL